MKKKLIFIGLVALALVLTSGTFAYTYNWQDATTITASLSEDNLTTYNVAQSQPQWDKVLPSARQYSETLLPAAAGDQTDFPSENPSGSIHYQLVSDIGAADTDAYISTDGARSWVNDLYTLTSYTGMAGLEDIQSLTINYRIAAGGDYAVNAKPIIEIGGNIYEGPTVTHQGTDFITYSWQVTASPITNKTWTPAELNQLQIGIGGEGSSKHKPLICTYVYATASYSFKIIEGAVPLGGLYDVTPAQGYTGDLMVKIYLTNTADLLKAYNYLNIKVYVANSLEASQTPNYQVLSIENGVVVFHLIGGTADIYSISIIGGAYRLVSSDPSEWSAGWSVVPEFYCEVTQR